MGKRKNQIRGEPPKIIKNLKWLCNRENIRQYAIFYILAFFIFILVSISTLVLTKIIDIKIFPEEDVVTQKKDNKENKNHWKGQKEFPEKKDREIEVGEKAKQSPPKVNATEKHSINSIRNDTIKSVMVTLFSDPTGARVFLNDKETYWVTPITVKLSPGTYRITLVKEGYKSKTDGLIIYKKDKKRVFTWDLEKEK